MSLLFTYSSGVRWGAGGRAVKLRSSTGLCDLGHIILISL